MLAFSATSVTSQDSRAPSRKKARHRTASREPQKSGHGTISTANHDSTKAAPTGIHHAMRRVTQATVKNSGKARIYQAKPLPVTANSTRSWNDASRGHPSNSGSSKKNRKM